MKEDDWDPAPDERVYYRSSEDNQRAYLVRRDGKDMLRLDRPMEEILRPMNQSWKSDNQVHAVNAQQLAQVAFAADRQLCRVLGRHNEATLEWLSLKEPARIKWMKKGPCTGDIREDLFDAIMGTLGSLADGG